MDFLVDHLVDRYVDRYVDHLVDHRVDPLVVNPVVLHRNSTLLARNWAICINEHSAEEIPQLLSQIRNGSNLARRPQKRLSDRPSIPTRISTNHEVSYEALHEALHAVIYEVLHAALHAVIYEAVHEAIHAVIYEEVHEVIHVAMPTVLHAAWRYATRRFPSPRLPTCPYPLLAADTRPPESSALHRHGPYAGESLPILRFLGCPPTRGKIMSVNAWAPTTFPFNLWMLTTCLIDRICSTVTALRCPVVWLPGHTRPDVT